MDNAIVVELLCKYLDVLTLKTVRQVSKIWREEALRELLLYRTIIRIPPGYHQMSRRQQFQSRTALLNHLQCPHSRWRRFTNIRICQHEDIATLHSLHILCRDVRHLQVSREIFPVNPPADNGQVGREKVWRKLEYLLKNGMTSVESLTFFKGQYNDRCPDFFRMEDLNLLIKLDKIHWITSLALQPTDLYPNPNNFNTNLEKLIKTLEKISEHPLRLQSILLGHGNKRLQREQPGIFTRYIECLNKILESSKDTIQKMEVSDILSIFPSFRIPVMARLIALNAVDAFAVSTYWRDMAWWDFDCPIFPERDNPGQGQGQVNLFPNLRWVTMTAVSEHSLYLPFLGFETTTFHRWKTLLPMIVLKRKSVEMTMGKMAMTFSKYSHPVFSFSVGNRFKLEYLRHGFLVWPPGSIPFQNIQTLRNRINEVKSYQTKPDYTIASFVIRWLATAIAFCWLSNWLQLGPGWTLLILILVLDQLLEISSSLRLALNCQGRN